MKPLYKDIMGTESADWQLPNYPAHRKQGKKYNKKTFFFGTVWKTVVLHGYTGG
jgi:hypothetical protein